MCTLSMVGDGYHRQFPERWPNIYPWLETTPATTRPVVTKAEFDALRDEVTELRELLEAARRFDIVTGQPDCETAEKMEFIRKLMDWLGIDSITIFDRADPVP